MNIYWYAPFNNAYELTLADHLCRAGDKLVVQSLRSRFGKPLPVNKLDFELVRNLPEPAGEGYFRRSALRRTIVAIERALRRDRLATADFDLLHIHTYNMFTDWAALRLLRRRRRPIILWVHNVLPHERRGPYSVEKWLHQTGYRSVNHIIVAHSELRTALIRDFQIDAEMITVLPLLVPDVGKVCDVQREPRELLFFGTLRENKGIDSILEALQYIPRELEFTIRFAGRGVPALHQRIEEAALVDERILPEFGWVPPERQAFLFSRAWAVLLPYTEFSAQSGVLTDAYSYRVPVVASELAALGAAVRHDQSGWLVPPSNARALAACIMECLTNDAAREERSAAIDRVVDARAAPVIGARLRDLYDTVAGRYSASPPAAV